MQGGCNGIYMYRLCALLTTYAHKGLLFSGDLLGYGSVQIYSNRSVIHAASGESYRTINYGQSCVQSGMISKEQQMEAEVRDLPSNAFSTVATCSEMQIQIQLRYGYSLTG